MNSADLPHFRRLFDSLVFFAHGKGVPLEDAEDLVASAIESAVKRFNPDRGTFGSVCTTAVSNLIKNYWRDRKSHAAGVDLETLEDPEWALLFFKNEEARVMNRRLALITEKLDDGERAFLGQLRSVIEEMGECVVSEASRRLGLTPAKGWDLLRKIRRKAQQVERPLPAGKAAFPRRAVHEIVAERRMADYSMSMPVDPSGFERLVRRLPPDRLREIEALLARQ